jgi:hypothetical protein
MKIKLELDLDDEKVKKVTEIPFVTFLGMILRDISYSLVDTEPSNKYPVSFANEEIGTIEFGASKEKEN